MAPRRSSGCGVCILELTTRRHRGRLLCLLGSRAKASKLRGRHKRFAGGSVSHTSFRRLLSLLGTQQKWYHHLHQQVEQSLIPRNYYIRQVQHIRWCTQHTVCSTHTHTHTRTVTELLFTYYCGLLSLLGTQQKWYHHLHQQVEQSLIPHNYYIHQVQHIRWCTQHTVCSTHTHTHPYCN